MEAILISTAILTGSLVITEVCSNPPDETAGEFIEFHNDSTEQVDITGFSITDGDALDELLPWAGTFPQAEVQTGTSVIPPGGYAVLLEEGYINDPWLNFQTGTVILTTGDQSICNGLAASSDPLTLYNQTGTTMSSVISTFGTPFPSDNWQDRDDDQLDSIPFDPGEGFTLYRYPLNVPDSEAAWYTAEPTPGSPPDAPSDTFLITVDSLLLSEDNPQPGSAIFLTAVISCWGTVSPDSGSVTLYLDSNGDSIPNPGEVLLSIPAQELQPGRTDTLVAFFTAPEQGCYPAACSAPECHERIHFTTGGGINPHITEVMANPIIEDQEEYIEIYYPGPGVFPLDGCSFTDGDAVDQITSFQNGGYILPEQTALIIDPEYNGTLAIPGNTPLFIPQNTTLGNGLTTDDPVLLYNGSEPSLEVLLSTAGSPLLNDDPLLCDDNGTDSIPFDPGDGFSMEKIIPEGPDQQFNWVTSQPGGTPGTIPDIQGWTDLATDSITHSNVFSAFFSNRGAVEATGLASIFIDGNGNLLPDPEEILHQSIITLQPGETGSVFVPWSLPDSGIFTAAAIIENEQDTTAYNNSRHIQLLPENPAWPVITEVLCNPSNEDCDEFIELFFPGPGQVDITQFTITDNDTEDDLIPQTTQFLTPGAWGLILDPEYENGSQPYDIPPDTPVFHPGNTTLGDGLSGTDPVILLHDSAEVSTYGTPEDESDGIPFDPGSDLSVERISSELPDNESNWFSSPDGPTPGEPPQGMTQGVDYKLTTLSAAPPMGQQDLTAVVTAFLTSAGTDSVVQGELSVSLSADGSLLETSQPQIPGLEDTVAVCFTWQTCMETTELAAEILCLPDQNQENNTALHIWNPPTSIVINEIFYHEPEWLELYNGTDTAVDLSSVTVSDRANTIDLPEYILPPECYAVITENESDFTQIWGNTPCDVLVPDNWVSLNNSGDSLLLHANSIPSDMVPYTSQWGGNTTNTLERRSTEVMGFLEENWGTSVTAGTPGTENSIGETSQGEFMELSPVVFNPPETPLHIQINLPMQACNVTVKVYDVRGMELEKLYDGIVPGETLILQWTGQDLPIGRYIIHAEANCSGEVITDAAVVVLARPLG